MKKILMIVASLTSLVFATEIEGFREIKFGDTIDKLGKYKLLNESTDKREKTYEKIGDNLKIGNVKLETIIYSFCNNKLCCITGYFNEKGDFDILEKAFTNKYGNPDYKKSNSLKQVRGFGNVNTKYIMLSYDKYGNGYKGWFMYSDNILNTMIENERAKEAAKGL